MQGALSFSLYQTGLSKTQGPALQTQRLGRNEVWRVGGGGSKPHRAKSSRLLFVHVFTRAKESNLFEEKMNVFCIDD